MANTINKNIVARGKNIVSYYLTLVYVDAQETDYILHDSSAIATASGVADPKTCAIKEITYSLSASSTARAKLEFDADTDVLALDLVPQRPTCINFQKSSVGSLRNYAGTGKTGDLLLTTTGLASGDMLTMLITLYLE